MKVPVKQQNITVDLITAANDPERDAGNTRRRVVP